MSVDGQMLGGTNLPNSLVRWADAPEPSGSMPNATEEEHMFGADFAYMFIDLDDNESTGFSIGGAESAVMMGGKDGRILVANAYRYVNYSWELVGPVEAAVDAYRLEVSAPFEGIGLSDDGVYHITFLAQDWRGSEDLAAVSISSGVLTGSRAVGDILINEVYSTSAKGIVDWVELYNVSSVPVDISGWVILANGVVVYTIPEGTILLPGDFYVTPKINLGTSTLITLLDEDRESMDEVLLPYWSVKSYGLVGLPGDYYWAIVKPSPGELNPGQVAIPEFGDLLIPLAIVPLILFAIRRTQGVRGKERGDSEGKSDGST
jgi:hypothetical protein